MFKETYKLIDKRALLRERLQRDGWMVKQMESKIDRWKEGVG